MAKLIYEEVKNFIEIESGSGCKLLSEEYFNVNHPLELKCKCGTEFNTTFAYFKRAKNPKMHCDDCGLKIRASKRTFAYEDVKAYIEVESKSKCKLISKEYIRSDKTLEILCKCGTIFKTTFTRFKSKDKPKNRCDDCAKRQRSENRIIEATEHVEITSKSDCIVVNANLSDKAIGLELKCRCGNIFKTNFNRFKNRGKRMCGECKRDAERQHYLRDFKNKVAELEKGEYIVVGDFKDTKTKIQIFHKGCKNTYSVVPNNFINGNRCPHCNKSKPKTDKSFKQDVYSIVENEYTVLGGYKTINHKIDIKHNTCGGVFNISANAFLNLEQRCPFCNESKGERTVRRYLNASNVSFIKEYSFDDLLGVGGGLLRFDFAIFNKGKLTSLVEYDGEFHFKKQYYNDGYEELQIHDERKNQYCKDNNIPLLRIPYWEFDNIESILEKWLKPILNKRRMIKNG